MVHAVTQQASNHGSPLAGLRVVELGCGWATAHVGRALADFGAEVTVVEPPNGNPLRAAPAWPYLVRSKRRVALDLHADLGAVADLCASADVVIDANEEAVADATALTHDALEARNPGLVRTTISAFGDDGPYPWMPADEAIVMAKIGGMSAFAAMTDRDGPAYVSVPFCSFSAAQTALHGTLAALLDRESTGVGQRVTTSLLHGIAGHDVWNWYLRIITQRYPDAYTPAPHVEDGVPNSALVFRLLVALSADADWMQFSQTSRHLYVALMEQLGMGSMFDDPYWKDIPLVPDGERRVELWDRMLEAVRGRTTVEWNEVFDANRDVWAERFRSGTEVLDHPQLVHDGSVIAVADPDLGDVRQPGPLARVVLHPTAAVTRSAPDPDAVGPLAGITVVELAMYYAAPYAAALLADLGARVIKVEPIGGDPLRALASFPEVGGIKAMQGKQSIELDAASPEGRRIVEQLISGADVVVQSFRAGVAERLGVDAASARRINPDIVYLTAPGYGVGGPCGARPAFAPTIAAASGLAWRLVGPTMPGDPVELDVEDTKCSAVRMIAATNTSFAQCDGLAALAAATAALAGLVGRARGAGAADVSTSMLLTAANANCDDVVDYTGRPPTPTPDAELLGLGARHRLYRAATGWVFLSSAREGDLERLVAAVAGQADLSAAIDAGEQELAVALAAMFATQPAADWERDLTAARVRCVEVADGPVEAVLLGERSDEFDHLRLEVEHPMLGHHPRLAPLVHLSRTPLRVRGAEGLGASTGAVLGELGYDEAAVGELRRAGRIG
jgi:crotonobetainyl-CoA:carnitine CoA-transferase CaiB-like acyl-CoA transferase